MIKIGGYRPLVGEIDCSKFSDNIDKFIKLAATTNTRYIIPDNAPIMDQGDIGSCTANAIGDAFEILKGLEDPTKIVPISRLFIYYNERMYINETNVDGGAQISDGLNSLTKLGVCTEATWTYDTSKVLVKPTIEAYKEANDNTFMLTNYYQINTIHTDRQNDIITAVKANHPVVFGVQVGQELEDYDGSTKVFEPPTKSIGGHALIIVGFRVNAAGSNEFYVKNSWSKYYGMSEVETANLGKGHMWFSAAYIDTIVQGDCFVPTRMPAFLV